jgi:gluconolactonase
VRTLSTLALLGALLGTARAATGEGAIERFDPRVDAVVPRDAVVERIAAGFGWVEGPVWDARRGTLFFSDVAGNTVYAWREAAGAAVFLRPSGYSGAAPFPGQEPGANGLALDAAGRLVLCEHGDRRVTRLEPDATRTVLAARYDGRRLNSPNDVVVAPNGDAYFTDPPFGLPDTFHDRARELDFSGVFRVRTPGRPELLTREVAAPNGIALSPDVATLYVANAERTRPVVLAFRMRPDGGLDEGRVLWDATRWLDTGPGVPDGIDVDRAGNLVVGGPAGVYVLAPDGTLLGRIATGVATANVGLGHGPVVYVAASSAVYRVGPPRPPAMAHPGK